MFHNFYTVGLRGSERERCSICHQDQGNATTMCPGFRIEGPDPELERLLAEEDEIERRGLWDLRGHLTRLADSLQKELDACHKECEINRLAGYPYDTLWARSGGIFLALKGIRDILGRQ